MYDSQFYHVPAIDAFLTLNLYLNGDFTIESDWFTDDYLLHLCQLICESHMEPDEYLTTIWGLEYLGPLPL